MNTAIVTTHGAARAKQRLQVELSSGQRVALTALVVACDHPCQPLAIGWRMERGGIAVVRDGVAVTVYDTPTPHRRTIDLPAEATAMASLLRRLQAAADAFERLHYERLWESPLSRGDVLDAAYGAAHDVPVAAGTLFRAIERTGSWNTVPRPPAEVRDVLHRYDLLTLEISRTSYDFAKNGRRPVQSFTLGSLLERSA